jgi:hypothetical protein
MSRSVHVPVAVAIAFALVSTVAIPALAEDGRATTRPERNQIEVFDDDPLDAVGLVERGTRVRSRRPSGRTTLIRPRLHFIAELTKSVENL